MATQTTIKKLPMIKEDTATLKLRIQEVFLAVKLRQYIIYFYIFDLSWKEKFQIIKTDSMNCAKPKTI